MSSEKPQDRKNHPRPLGGADAGKSDAKSADPRQAKRFGRLRSKSPAPPANDAPRPDAPKKDVPKQGVAKKDAPKAEASRKDAPRPPAKPAVATATDGSFAKRLQQFSKLMTAVRTEIGKVVYGQEEVVKQMLACVFARGHCLMVGVPGLAKTLMVQTMSRVTNMSFRRIQFTPDLMPSDITGTNIIDETSGKREFRFVPGPLFAHIVLGDEINRTPPKTQAALLEAMQERQVTVGQTTYDLPRPFFVIATQNPIEQEGTYPLPEAQLDRFMFNIYLDYPESHVEEKIISETTHGVSVTPDRVMTGQQLLDMQRLVQDIVASPYVVKYATNIIRATRPAGDIAPDFVRNMVNWGCGPRAGQYLILGGKAMAAMDGRFNVSTQDIRDVAVPVMRHRIGCNFQAQAEGMDSVKIVKMLLEAIPEPDIRKTD